MVERRVRLIGTQVGMALVSAEHDSLTQAATIYVALRRYRPGDQTSYSDLSGNLISIHHDVYMGKS